jgi:ArsR family transcriptional regulator
MSTRTAGTQGEVAGLFHALSDPTRLDVLRRLRRGERCVCDLMDALDAAQSRLSFHLKVLRDAGLVRGRRDGQWVYYTLVPAAIEQLQGYLGDMVPAFPAHPDKRKAGCCD